MHFRRLNFPLFPSNVTQSLAERQSPAGIKRGSRAALRSRLPSRLANSAELRRKADQRVNVKNRLKC